MLQRKTPLRRNSTPMKSTGKLKRGGPIKKKSKTAEQLQEDKENREKMWNLFIAIYNERGPYSEISGEYLGPEPMSWMFDHLLEKSKYPELKYLRPNILMVTMDEHSAKTNGFPVEKHQKAIDRVKQKFGII